MKFEEFEASFDDLLWINDGGLAAECATDELCRRLAACANACSDMDTEALEKIVAEGRTLEFALANSLKKDKDANEGYPLSRGD